MNYKIISLLAVAFLFSNFIGAQHSKYPSKNKAESVRYNPEDLQKVKDIRGVQKNAARQQGLSAYPYKTVTSFDQPQIDHNFTYTNCANTNLPILIKGEVAYDNSSRSIEEQCYDFLQEVKKDMQIKNVEESFVSTEIIEDELNMTAIRMQQVHQGLPVYGSEIILHASKGKIRNLVGRYYPSSKIENITPSIQAEAAKVIAIEDIKQHTTVREISGLNKHLVGEEIAELVIYHPDNKVEEEYLTWHFTLYPNITERWEYFVDAKTSEIISFYKNSCSLHCTIHNHDHAEHNSTTQETDNEHSINNENTINEAFVVDGPAVANANDLFGIGRTINTYEVGTNFFLIDASRSMFNNSQSQFPNEGVGIIWTIDGGNNHPQDFNFSASHVTSTNNNWNNPTAVSAHYNGGLAYEYFKNTFGRESINGNGGNIVSLINIAEENGSSMENAFWNGQAMFYGNGGQAFDPLAKALDVAGHEMSHGVIQTTANLEYVGQSGALNESFADIFGAMMDRNDWQLGEEVVNPNVFPSGALRDLSNPNNGGNSSNDPGWQPKTMSEYLNLPNTPQGDNGGVHFNSGITNYAFFLIASDIGKSNAEDIYYRALTQYLTKSSQFTDCRIAVTQAATDIFGGSSNEVSAVNNAFNAVGIAGGSGGNYEEDLEVNEGDDYVLHTDDTFSKIYLNNPDGTNTSVLSNRSPMSKPSVTDDGSGVIYIATDKKMYFIEIDWSTGAIDEFVIQDEAIWRNVAISKDGNRLSALTDENDNGMYIYDFGLEEWNFYELYNPTFTQGQTTGDIQFADAMEWDISSQSVLYDANNKIASNFGDDIEYWDASFIKVFNTNQYEFADGSVEKLFASLPENTSIGNPTFAKNSPYIVAYDYIDANGNYNLLATNIETGETSPSPIYQNNVLNYPNYARLDDKIVFDAQDNNGATVLGVTDLKANKIESVPNTAFILFDQARWGVWFAEGERDLVDINQTANTLPLLVYPNPFESTITFELDAVESGLLNISIHTITGKELISYQTDIQQGIHQENINLEDLPAGTYVLYATMNQQLSAHKIVKLK